MTNFIGQEEPTFHAEYQMWYRPSTYDLEIIDEVLRRRAYRAVTVSPTDVVLDIGGNIGAAAHYFAALGAAVVSYEPDPSSVELLRRNVLGLNVQVIESAITRSSEVVELFRNPGRNQACNSTQRKRGYRSCFVSSTTLTEALVLTRATVVKCDIEGGEFDVWWPTLRDFPRVREVIMEVHMGRKAWREVGLPLVLEQLEEAGFTLRSPRPPTSNASFNRLLHWSR